MKTIEHIFLSLVLCLCPVHLKASTGFLTAELKRLATAVNVQVDQLQVGYQSIVSKGDTIVIHVADDSTVDHIGRSLFPESLKKAGNRVVMEFLERYMLQLQYPPQPKTAAMMLRDDNVKFIKGSVATLRQLQLTDEFNLSCELMNYTASWQRAGKTLLYISFPAEFELLRGMNFIEAQHLFEGESRKAGSHVRNTFPLDKHLMKATGIADCYMLPGGYYLNEKLNSNRYYVEGADGVLQPLLSEDHPAESVANLMLCPEIAGQRSIHITERLYGFQSKNFVLNLSQWITFCLKEHCELYFGIQGLTETAVKATVIAVNTDENYNHLLTLTVPISVIANPEGTIEAQLNCYLPTHNIRNLFGKDRSKKKAKYHL